MFFYVSMSLILIISSCIYQRVTLSFTIIYTNSNEKFYWLDRYVLSTKVIITVKKNIYILETIGKNSTVISNGFVMILIYSYI